MWRIATSKGSGVYVIWGWRIRPMGVAYTSNGPTRPKGPIDKYTLLLISGT